MKDGLLFRSESYNWAKSIPTKKYGKSSESANAHIKSVMVLLTINITTLCKIHFFYKRFIAHINTLDTMRKLNKINGYVVFTLDKLCGIRGNLVRTDNTGKTGDLMSWLKQYVYALKETLLRDLKDQTNNSRKNIKKSISWRHFKRPKQENASVVEAKITN